jgi:hypothetical protein
MWLAVAAKKKFLRKNTEEMLASQPRELGSKHKKFTLPQINVTVGANLILFKKPLLKSPLLTHYYIYLGGRRVTGVCI